MQILLIEDDPSVAASVIDGLETNGFAVTHVPAGQPGIEQVKKGAVELVLLDLGLPDIDGQDVCRNIRTFSNIPIIILSARNEEVDRVLSLEFGADDYLVKPFGMRELVARIRAVARRTSSDSGLAGETNIQEIGALKLDRRAQRVFLAGEEIHLTSKEFDLLAYLAQDPGAVFRRHDIMNDVWDTNWYGTTKTVDAHVAAIRKKLGQQDWIEAVRGVGFRLNVPAS